MHSTRVLQSIFVAADFVTLFCSLYPSASEYLCRGGFRHCSVCSTWVLQSILRDHDICTVAVDKMSLATVGGGIFKHITSFLCLDDQTPGTHRELARKSVGQPVDRKYLVHHPEYSDEYGAATEIETYRRQWVGDAYDGHVPGRCDVCSGGSGDADGLHEAAVGVVHMHTFMEVLRLPSTDAATDWIGDRLAFEDMRVCFACREVLYCYGDV